MTDPFFYEGVHGEQVHLYPGLMGFIDGGVTYRACRLARPEGYEKTFHGTRYELYDVGKVDVIEWHGNIKGKGLLVFFPDKPRLKKDIRN